MHVLIFIGILIVFCLIYLFVKWVEEDAYRREIYLFAPAWIGTALVLSMLIATAIEKG